MSYVSANAVPASSHLTLYVDIRNNLGCGLEEKILIIEACQNIKQKNLFDRHSVVVCCEL